MVESHLCCHDWDATEHWGVIIGVSRCSRCGKLSMAEDFPWLLQIKHINWFYRAVKNLIAKGVHIYTLIKRNISHKT